MLVPIRTFGLLGWCLTMGFVTPVLAQSTASPSADLNRVESSLKQEQQRHEQLKKKAEALARDIRDVRAKMVETATTVRKRERELISLENRLADLQVQEKDLKTIIDRRGDQMVTVIAALQRLAWRPTEALIAQPTPPSDTVRSAILLRTAVPRIEASARELKTDLDKLSILQAQVQGQKDRIAAVTANLAQSHSEMKSLFKRQATMQQETRRETTAAAKRMQDLAKQASSLKDLIAKLEAERARQREEARMRVVREAQRQMAEERAHKEKIARLKREKKLAEAREEERKEKARLARQEAKAREEAAIAAARPPQRSFRKARGRLPMPAVGKVTSQYGQLTQAGIHAKGISIRTRSEAQVITPFDGTVLFSGPFRGYGQLLIIEYGGGYHMLLAGMNRIDATTGQTLLAGEPVGVMTNATSPELYVELRHEGQPINPLPWLTAGKSGSRQSKG